MIWMHTPSPRSSVGSQCAGRPHTAWLQYWSASLRRQLQRLTGRHTEMESCSVMEVGGMAQAARSRANARRLGMPEIRRSTTTSQPATGYNSRARPVIGPSLCQPRSSHMRHKTVPHTTVADDMRFTLAVVDRALALGVTRTIQ